jgi:PBSX family phage terminase large subunit
LTKKQLEYLDNCNHRWNVKTGATGSGKSYLDIAVTIPKRIIASKNEGLIVLIGNTKGTLERNILSPMRDLYKDLVGTVSSDNTVNIFGKKCYALGADNKKHVARIQGATFEYCYGDEVTTWSEEVFQMLKSRLRCKHSHFDGTCNPDNPKHWFKAFLDSDADIYQQAYVIDDGVLPQDIVDQLKKEYAGTVYYDRFINGLWVAAEGAIYRTFADTPERFLCAPSLVDFTQPEHLDIVKANIGVDFGGGTSAHAFSCVGFTRGMKKLVVLAEYREKEALTPEKLNKAFADFVRSCKERWFVPDVYCDSAEQTLINGLRQTAQRERLQVNVSNALKKPINERIRATCVLMGANRFLINKECHETIDALRSAVWDSKKLTEDVRLDNGTTNIDSLDAFEYAWEREIQQLMGARL